MRESWRIYREVLWRHSRTLVSGSAAGAAGIAFSIHPIALPAWLWFLIAVAAVAWLGFVAFHDIRVDRDEARAALRQPFPNMKIQVPAVSRWDTADYPLLAFPTLITNREETRVSLNFQMWVELAKEPGESLPLRSEESVKLARASYEAALRGERPETAMPMLPTMQIEPLTTEQLELHVTWDDSDADRCADPPPDASPSYRRSPLNGQGDRLRLDVIEHVSGQTISLYVPGTYETRGEGA